MVSLYRVFLSIHIIAIVCWMAGILYLIRLFVYHSAETVDVVKERFTVMENRLYRFITLPAMLASLIFGVILILINPSLLQQGWLHTKLLLVFFMIGLTHMGGKWGRELQAGTSKKTTKFFRIANEVPTLLMIAIVFLVILKPF
jgi:protoporphyrinogen IX oxidase